MTIDLDSTQTGTKAYFRTYPGSGDASRYHQGDYEQSDLKHDQRLKVLRFLLSFFQPGEVLRPITMPGLNWRFEHAAISHHGKNLHFIGVENRISIYHRAKCRMPSISYGPCAIAHHTYTMGTAEFEYSRSTAQEGAKHIIGPEKNHRYVNLRLSDLLSLLGDGFGASKDEKRKFFAKFLCRNCAWLDFTSGFSSEVEKSLALLPLSMSSDPRPKPIVVTLMYGRDISGRVAARIRKVEALMHQFSCLDSWLYRGKGRSNMLTICGEIS